MTLTELFLPHTNQEFPPKHVYAYVADFNMENPQVKSLAVKQLPEYETMYKFSGMSITETSELWNDPKQEFSLPVLQPKTVV